MSNTLELIGNVARNLDDLGANFYSPTEDIQPSLQDGYNLIAGITECIEDVSDIDFADGKVYYDFKDTIPNYLRIFGIFNNNTQRWMYPTSLLELYSLRDNWELATGDPYLFLPIDYRKVALFPVMPRATGSMTVLYKATANPLSANGVPNIPIENHNVLEWYATDDLLDQAQEWTKALKFAGMVDKGIEDIKKVLRNRQSPNHLYYKHETY